jgi:peptidoglycan/xylan/chitin deacetylase (PgdA/CDA1 family)
MPPAKRAALAAALLAPVALLGAAGVLLRVGHAGAALALAAGTAAATLAALHAFWPRFDPLGRSLRRGPRRGRAVALTFDDGPSDDTPAVLEALEQAGVRATFFVLGTAARRRPELLREVARRGHLVALHGDTHVKLHLAGPARVARELDRCAAALREAGVVASPLFRAPHGFRGPFLGPALKKRGLTLAAWTRGVFDSARPGAEVIAARASARPRPGEILLLHDGCGTPGIDPRRDQTAAAIPEIVRRWREAGFEFVTLDAFVKP